MITRKMTVKETAIKIAKLLKKEKPDYFYLKALFRSIREELRIKVEIEPKYPLYIPTEEEMKKYYTVVFKSNNIQNIIIIKTLLYTGVRVGEITNIKLSDINLDNCTIKINIKRKDRIVLFPNSFKEALAMHIQSNKAKGAIYLFESPRKKPYSTRGIRKIVVGYSKLAEMPKSISPMKLRHFLFAWMKEQNIADHSIQPYAGLERPTSLNIYSKTSVANAQKEYTNIIKDYPI